MFKTILSLAVIALVSTTDASKITTKTLKVNHTLAQLRAKSHLMQNKKDQDKKEDKEETDSDDEEESDSDSDDEKD